MSDILPTERACAEIINSYLFDKVWNEPVSEYRSNILPAKFTKNSVVGMVATTEGKIPLPTNRDAYYIWMVGTDEMHLVMSFPDRTWVSAVECMNDYRVKLDFYDVSGKVFPKSAIYLRYSYDKRTVLIALKRDAANKCSKFHYIDTNQVYLTTYYDSDVVNAMKVLSFKVDTTDMRETVPQHQMDEMLKDVPEHQRIIYKNGVEITQGGAPGLTNGDYFDILVDKNIIFAFDVDLVTKHERPAYRSVKDKMWKQLIHIPKALNPDNRIYTHDTCDFYIRRKEGVRPYGLFMHRVANASVTQVTHNDFGIPLVVIDAYRDYLDEQEIEIHVVVRRHDKDNFLIREANYLELLYVDRHDDDTIIDILCGLGPAKIDWWRAENLEASAYVEMMFDTPNKMWLDSKLMDKYIDALGYHQVINLLCGRTLDTVVGPKFTGSFVLRKPMLYSNYTVLPSVYLNGKHLSFDKVKFVDDHGQIFISIDPKVVVKEKDVITTVFYLSSNNRCAKFELTESNREWNLPYTDPIVYEEQNNAKDETIIGCNGKYTKSYIRLGHGDNIYSYRDNHDGTCTLTFNVNYIGSTFVVQNRYASYIIQKDITPLVEQGKSLAITLEATDAETGEVTPIFAKQDVTVFYNGKYLVKGMDYTISDVKDRDKHICASELIIQTMDHYTDKKNRVDILVNQDLVRDSSCGFMIGGKLYDKSPINLQYSQTTTVHVDGRLERNSVNKGNYTVLPAKKYKTGVIWEIQTSIPKVVSDFIAKYSSKNDDDRLEILNEYFGTLPEPEPPIIELDGKHRVYSVFLNEVIQEIIRGSFAVSADPDSNRLDEALGPYLRFKLDDVVYKKMDGRFVDYYPQYTNKFVPPDKKATVDYLVHAYLPKNLNPSLHSIAEECD